MGSITYDYLSDSLLFDQSNLDSDFKNESVENLNKWLQEYRSHVLKSDADLKQEVSANTVARLFLEDRELDLDFLKQAALYVPQVIIEDPLFRLTAKEGKFAKTGKQFLGFSSEINKPILASTLRSLKAITPMIATDYVKLVPASLITEPPENIEINFPINQYRDVLPPEILLYCSSNANVKGMQKLGGLWKMLNSLQPCRGLFINFGDYQRDKGFIYHYFDLQVLNTEDSGIVEFIQTMPDTPPSEDAFNAWLTQSLNSSCIQVVNSIIANATNANCYNSSLLTTSSFACGLLGVHEATIEEKTINGTLALDLPFLESVSIEDLMNIRNDNAKEFLNFRLELERLFRSLKTTDSNDLKLASKNAQHELVNVQIPRLKNSFSSFKKSAPFKLSPTLMSLASTFFSGPSLLGTSIAMLNMFNTWKDYSNKVKENPCVFLHKLEKASKNSISQQKTDRNYSQGGFTDIRYSGVQVVPSESDYKKGIDEDSKDESSEEGILYI